MNHIEFKKYRLGDIASVEISSVDKKSYDDGIPVRLCNFVDVYHNWAITEACAEGFMKATANNREIEKFLIHKGQVAITKDSETRDDIGISTYMADNFNDVVLGYHCALITPNKDIVCGKYLNAFMHTSFILKYFENNASGSGQRYTLSVYTIYDIPVLLPNIQIQHVIGKLLADIDRKIELNKAINHNLEALAKQLYDYWFVQFDFPDENGRPYKSSGGKMVWNERLKREIPEGWCACNIKEILDIYKTTKRYATTEYLKNGKYPIVDQDSSRFICGYTNDENNIVRKYPAVLFGDHSTCVKFIDFEFARGADGTQILYSKDNRIKPLYLYFAIKNLKIPNPGYSRHFKYLKELPIILPEIKVANVFQDSVVSVFSEIKYNNDEIKTLTDLRNTLLPLLMNGQATIRRQ